MVHHPSNRGAAGTADAILAALKPIVEGIADTLGPTCEVVLHDYRTPDRSVVAIAGSVTGRTVGGAMSEIGLRTLKSGDAAENEINYLTRTRDGRTIRSSTLPIRDDTGLLVGAVCINVDVGAFQIAHDILSGLIGGSRADAPASSVTTFTDDFADVVDSLVRMEEARAGKPVTALSRSERVVLVGQLHERGLFEVRGSVPRIASRLGISRAALYSDLAAAREGSHR